jgi:Alginate export
MSVRRPIPRSGTGLAILAATWVVALVASRAIGADDRDVPAGVPDATITFRGRTATIGAGFLWGASTLTYQGKTYPVRVDGFVLGAIGTASLDGVGKVYHLSKAEDLNGDYTALTVGGAFGVGSGSTAMRNEKGVRIVWDITAKGFALGIGPRGITLTLGEAGGPPADAGARLPPTIAFGQGRLGPLMLRPTLNAQLVGFAEGNAGFGGQWSYVKNDWVMKYMKLGVMYFKIYNSKNVSRDGMNGVYGYHEATPLSSLPDLSYTTSYVWEGNSKNSGLKNAIGWYAGPAYQLSTLPWEPQLFYRYASFSGAGTKSFDFLFAGLPDWGSWFQGEILGEFVLSNSNLNSHQVRLKLQPNEVLTLNLIYYKFLLYEKNQEFGLTPSRVSSSSLADEMDMILDVSLTNWWSMTATFAFAVPNDGFREAVNGSATWLSGMLYTNFNF